MALHTLGTSSTTALTALTWSQGASQLLPADLAAVAESIIDDAVVGSIVSDGVPAAQGIIVTASTHSNTTLDTLVLVAGSPLTAITERMLVIGAGIPLGTYVSVVNSSTSVTLSQAATASATTVPTIFVPRAQNKPKLLPSGQLWVPRRGMLRVLPGDVVAVDGAGAVILVPGNSIAFGGSGWVYT